MQNSTDNLWETVFQQAVEFHGRGQLAEAGSLFAAILEYNPTHFPSLQRLAAIRRHQGSLEESRALLERAIDSNPSSAHAHNSLGNTLNALGRQEEAVEEYRRAVGLHQSLPAAHLNLGNSLKGLRRDDEAAAAFRDAIALRPEYVEAHTNLGVVLDRLNRPQDALASFSAALSFDPGVRLGYSNVGMALSALNRHEEAIPFLQRAREAEPDATEPVFNESILRLAMGDFQRGWRDYEARLQLPDLKLVREFPQPIWDGESEIAGSTIFLHAEQGLGDTILFARYVQAVVNKGAKVVLEVQKPLLRLLSALPGVVKAVTMTDPMPPFDLHTPFGSLPLAFRTTVQTIPSRTPYLQVPADSESISALEELAGQGLLVGVCWAGNPNYSADYKRSVPLAIFKRLFHVAGVRFVSLQQNLRPGDDSILAGFENVDLACDRKGKGLADTAALISKLDLVITVDTVIGHLAGALGRPVWILLPFSAYWVWMREREDSDWYASARLFRQSAPGDWEGVVDRLIAALEPAPAKCMQVG